MALAALCVAPLAPVRAQNSDSWVANDDDAILLDARVSQYRLGDGVRGYMTPSGPCVDLADVIMALDIPVRLDKKLRRATGWAFEESNSLLIDREAQTVQIRNISQKLATGVIFDTPEGWCVNAVRLGVWLGVKFEADTSNAILRITSEQKLPVELAAERRLKASRIRPQTSFDLKSMPQADFPYRGVKPPSVDVVANFGGLKDAGRKAEGKIEYQFYASGEIGPVAYDARLASNSKGVPDSLRVRAYRNDPEAGLFKGVLNATEVAVGDINAFSTPLVSNSNFGRGAMVTNRPLDRPDAFDRTDFRGELPSGWEAELYRNGELLAFSVDRADGRYEFLDVPLLYGQNQFEVVLYGPQGQTRREQKSMTVGTNSIPPKESYYWAGIMQDGRDLIDLGGQQTGTGAWRTALGVERGIDLKTSAALAFHSIEVNQVGRRNFLEASVRRALGPTLFEFAGTSDLQGGIALRTQMVGQFGKTNVSSESLIARGGFESERISSGLIGQHRVSINRALKIGRSVVPVQFDTLYTSRENGTRVLSLMTRASTNFGRHSFSSILRWDRSWDQGANPPSTVRISLLGNTRFGQVRLRGETHFAMAPHAQFERVSVIGEWSPKSEDRFRAAIRGEVAYDRQLDRGRLSLGYVKRFEKFAVTASAEADTDGGLALNINLAFSLGPDPQHPGGFRISSGKLASQGQILARVYRDTNRDGRRQADEPLEKDVQIAAGRAQVNNLTDTAGLVIVDNLEPFRPVLVGIDAGSLPDPLLQPATPGLVVTPRPGVIAVIELPLVSAGEVDGTLVRAGGNPIEGVDIELVSALGIITAKTRSDFDGFFIFESVPYGTYSLRIAKPSAEIALLRAELVAQVEIGDATPSVQLGIVAAEHNGQAKPSEPSAAETP